MVGGTRVVYVHEHLYTQPAHVSLNFAHKSCQGNISLGLTDRGDCSSRTIRLVNRAKCPEIVAQNDRYGRVRLKLPRQIFYMCASLDLAFSFIQRVLTMLNTLRMIASLAWLEETKRCGRPSAPTSLLHYVKEGN
jgi:hypothetical protein